MCGMIRIKQETCHTQDDGNPIKVVMTLNKIRYAQSKSAQEQTLLHDVNETFKKY